MADTGKGSEYLGELLIERRFRGPPESANGGYTCGRLAELLGAQATVRLMKPPPLDVRMDLVRGDGEIQLRHGDEVVARAWPGDPDVELPEAPGMDEARAQRANFAGHTRHAFPGCFVCGTDRNEGDGLLVHAGPTKQSQDNEHQVACNWTPCPSLCAEDGILPGHMVWAALDCPSGWAFLSFDPDVAVLGQMSASLEKSVRCGQEYVVAGWEIDRDGRKRHTGSAIYDADGTPLAFARATWITIDAS